MHIINLLSPFLKKETEREKRKLKLIKRIKLKTCKLLSAEQSPMKCQSHIKQADLVTHLPYLIIFS